VLDWTRKRKGYPAQRTRQTTGLDMSEINGIKLMVYRVAGKAGGWKFLGWLVEKLETCSGVLQTYKYVVALCAASVFLQNVIPVKCTL
jgi:hypothetical protein